MLAVSDKGGLDGVFSVSHGLSMLKLKLERRLEFFRFLCVGDRDGEVKSQ